MPADKHLGVQDYLSCCERVSSIPEMHSVSATFSSISPDSVHVKEGCVFLLETVFLVIKNLAFTLVKLKCGEMLMEAGCCSGCRGVGIGRGWRGLVTFCTLFI